MEAVRLRDLLHEIESTFRLERGLQFVLEQVGAEMLAERQIAGADVLNLRLSAVDHDHVECIERVEPQLQLPGPAKTNVSSNREINGFIRTARQSVAAGFQTDAAVRRPRDSGGIELPILIVRAAASRVTDVYDSRRVVRRSRQVHIGSVVLIAVAQVVVAR